MRQAPGQIFHAENIDSSGFDLLRCGDQHIGRDDDGELRDQQSVARNAIVDTHTTAASNTFPQ